MNLDEYLDAARAKLGNVSDYKLSQALAVTRGQISEARHRNRPLPNASVYRLAITLDLDPAEVLADLESQWEKDPKKQEFWKGFLSRAGKAAAVLILVSSFIGSFGHGPGTPGGLDFAAFAAYASVLLAVWVVRIITLYVKATIPADETAPQEAKNHLTEGEQIGTCGLAV